MRSRCCGLCAPRSLVLLTLSDTLGGAGTLATYPRIWVRWRGNPNSRRSVYERQNSRALLLSLLRFLR